MTWERELVPVEDIDIEKESINPDTWMKIYVYDGSGDYNADNTARYINWIDADDHDEYPYQHGRWYPVGTLIPLQVWVP